MSWWDQQWRATGKFSEGLLPGSSISMMFTDSRNYAQWLRLHRVRAMHMAMHKSKRYFTLSFNSPRLCSYSSCSDWQRLHHYQMNYWVNSISSGSHFPNHSAAPFPGCTTGWLHTLQSILFTVTLVLSMFCLPHNHGLVPPSCRKKGDDYQVAS